MRVAEDNEEFPTSSEEEEEIEEIVQQAVVDGPNPEGATADNGFTEAVSGNIGDKTENQSERKEVILVKKPKKREKKMIDPLDQPKIQQVPMKKVGELDKNKALAHI